MIQLPLSSQSAFDAAVSSALLTSGGTFHPGTRYYTGVSAETVERMAQEFLQTGTIHPLPMWNDGPDQSLTPDPIEWVDSSIVKYYFVANESGAFVATEAPDQPVALSYVVHTTGHISAYVRAHSPEQAVAYTETIAYAVKAALQGKGYLMGGI